MKSMKRAYIALMALACSVSADAQMRCGTELVGVGDTRVDLLRACGEPLLIEDAIDLIDEDERWTYNFGPEEFMMIVTLRDGEISRIDTGEYGFVESKP